MPGINIDQEEIDSRQAMLMDEAELNAMRESNLKRYSVSLADLEKREREANERLANIQVEIDLVYAEREKLVAAKEDRANQMVMSANMMTEEIKHELVEATKEWDAARAKGVEVEKMRLELSAQINIFKEQSAALNKTKDEYKSLVDQLSKNLEEIEARKHEADVILNDAKEKMTFAKQRIEAADEIYKENEWAKQRLDILTKDAQDKLAKAEETIKKMGPRWLTRGA